MPISLNAITKQAIDTQKNVTYFRVSGGGVLYRHIVNYKRGIISTTKILDRVFNPPASPSERFLNFWEAYAYRLSMEKGHVSPE